MLPGLLAGRAGPDHGAPKKGLLSTDQVRTAQVYSQEHNRDLRQSILELNLISPELLNQLAFERLSALAGQRRARRGGDRRGARAGGAALARPHPAPSRRPQGAPGEGRRPSTLSELVNQILERACDCEATDIHFDPQENGLRVRYRIDGQLQDILFVEPAMATPVISRLKIISNLNIVERRHSQDGRITIQHHNQPRDLRLATFPTTFGEKIVIRIHEVLTDVQGFTHLGMTADAGRDARPADHPALRRDPGRRAGRRRQDLDALQLPRADQLAAQERDDDRGPDRAPDPRRQPVPDQRPGEMGFSEGLRAMLRQDPDVIMIGEIRDDETARIGIRAALTGVLVFSTLHGSDAPSTISNLYNFGIPGYQLSSSLLAIVSQRLIRKICPYCRVTYTADEKVLTALELDPDRAPRPAAPPRPGLPGVLPDRLPGPDRDLRDHGRRRGAARPDLPADPQGRPPPRRG